MRTDQGGGGCLSQATQTPRELATFPREKAQVINLKGKGKQAGDDMGRGKGRKSGGGLGKRGGTQWAPVRGGEKKDGTWTGRGGRGP